MGRAALRRLLVAATAVTIVVTGDDSKRDVAVVALFPFVMLLVSLRRRCCPATISPDPDPEPQLPAPSHRDATCTPPRSARGRRPPQRRGGSAPRSRQPAGRP